MSRIKLCLADSMHSINEAATRDDQLEVRMRKINLQGRQKLFLFAVRLLSPVQPQLLPFDPLVIQILEVLAPWSPGQRVLHIGSYQVQSREAVRLKNINCGSSSGIDESDTTLCICTTDITKERDVCKTLWTQVYQGLNKLKKGGGMILLTNELYQRTSQLLVWVLCQVFEIVYIHKPETSSPVDRSNFVICESFSPSSFVQYQNMALIESPMLLADHCPSAWFSYITKVQNQFTLRSEEWKKRALVVYQMLLIHNILNDKSPKIEKLQKGLKNDSTVIKFTHGLFQSLAPMASSCR